MAKKSFIQKLILRDRTDEESGYTSPVMDYSDYLEKEGVTLSTLRPAGVAEIEGNRIDVITEGNFLDPGVPVRVIGLDGTRIIVREIKKA